MRNAVTPAATNTASATPRTRASASLPLSSPTQSNAPAGDSASEPASTKPATAASAPLRARVAGPTGAEWRLPKQWQSGARPRARFVAMATTKSEQQRQGTRGADDGGGGRYQQARHGELRDHERGREQGGKPLRRSEVADGAARALHVHELRDGRDHEDGCEQNPGGRHEHFEHLYLQAEAVAHGLRALQRQPR